MGLITENDIRKMLSEGLLKEKGEFFVGRDTILTPSARTFLSDKSILIKEEDVKKNPFPDGFETLFGVHLEEKPEHMTHLRGNLLVFKDHNRIVLRGAIDYLESEIILAQTVAEKNNRMKLVKDLEEIIAFIRKLLQSEITGKSLEGFILLGLDEKELREQSYHPSKYFGMHHFLPTYKHGEVVAYLNRLRTITRQTEISAFRAFKLEDGTVDRVDIIQAFNRLSSLFWIMMFKYLSGQYDS